MKKILLSIFIICIIFVFLFQNFGIQIGDIRIGKQDDLRTKQNLNIEQSHFYENYYAKKELTVLNLWATWCNPCVQEMPILNDIKSNYNLQKINFISISVDTDSIKLADFNSRKFFKFDDITIKNLEYINAILNTLENRKPDKWISSNSVPVTYLIKNKKVLEKIEGTVEKDELVMLIEKHK